MLETEIAFFEANLAEWLKSYRGQVALVHERELVGIFSTDAEALSEGVCLFGSAPFLVRPVLAKQAEQTAPALMLGILRAVH